MTTLADHDAYIAAAPEPFQPSLNRLRATLARALPHAEEIVAYNMPGFRIGGSVVASYAALRIYGWVAHPDPRRRRQGRVPSAASRMRMR